MSFWNGFDKQALSRKLLNRASRTAEKARELVSKISESEGLFPGPLAGKYHAQATQFARAANRRKTTRPKYMSTGAHFNKNYRKIFDSLKIKPKTVVEAVKEKK